MQIELIIMSCVEGKVRILRQEDFTTERELLSNITFIIFYLCEHCSVFIAI